MFDELTASERSYVNNILAKTAAVGGLLGGSAPAKSPRELLAYLTDLKNALGNLNNDISFVASLLVKPFLRERFGIEFDAALKPQGAAGPDIECVLPDGNLIVGEIKTTKPYQPGFGAKQKEEIRKDLLRLSNSAAAHRFMFVTDSECYRTICGKAFSSRAPGVEVVNLVTGEGFIGPMEFAPTSKVSDLPTPP
jgi:hypothetical protein